MDGSVIVHQFAMRDNASIGTAHGTATVQATRDDAGVVFAHESGHALFGMSDEYCCDGGYATNGPCVNIYASLAACQAAAPFVGTGPSQCMALSPTGGGMVWRINSGLETMADETRTSQFLDDGRACFNQRITRCRAGSC
jgi:hypothetical protein